MTEEKTETIADLRMKDTDKYTPQGRKEIADWLRRQADNLEKHPEEYDGPYRARFCVMR